MVRLPDPIIEQCGRVLVVRDDLIAGGTKRRVLASILRGGSEFVYASPAYGYAQIALAYTCADMGYQATIFTAKRKVLHKRTQEAKAGGAKIVLVPTGYLSNVQAKAKAYAEAVGAIYLPFGFDSETFINELAGVARALPIQPREVWTVAGSGTLTRALQSAWGEAVFHAVRIGKAPNIGRALSHTAPEGFEDDARQRPPFPSCSNYDAKAWQFIQQYASDGALFWNVAA
jgi:hypothetical protein